MERAKYATICVDEGVVLYDSGSRTLGETIPVEMANIEETVHVRNGFWAAFSKLSEQDADVISLLMCGYKYKNISQTIHNARYRIKIARKRFKKGLKKEGIDV